MSFLLNQSHHQPSTLTATRQHHHNPPPEQQPPYPWDAPHAAYRSMGHELCSATPLLTIARGASDARNSDLFVYGHAHVGSSGPHVQPTMANQPGCEHNKHHHHLCPQPHQRPHQPQLAAEQANVPSARAKTSTLLIGSIVLPHPSRPGELTTHCTYQTKVLPQRWAPNPTC